MLTKVTCGTAALVYTRTYRIYVVRDLDVKTTYTDVCNHRLGICVDSSREDRIIYIKYRSNDFLCMATRLRVHARGNPNRTTLGTCVVSLGGGTLVVVKGAEATAVNFGT